ncbi:hypothetical protein ASD15_29080 [Massilia sp. Root351]|jgi:hypothetical protein|uniref:Calx-beta domain-containing protein n=1 Tax=Massilia sp. Root351 TaxID=1736522 RepID=UPI000709B91B|nr:Calx-beta domain-containing protein [Massilia sp. Root351]KQV86646.1 hypothetical protein ASD15_29080 [Massilia sp. Root351]
MANTTVSVSFANGFVGDASRNNEASNAAYLTAKGWSNFQFSQVTNNGQFGGSQGNDYSGTILITDAAGVQHAIDGVINWRTPSGAVSTIVFYATGSAHTLATAGGGSYVIDPYTEVNGDARSFIGLTFNNATLAINNGSVTGNAATNGLMSALNTYLADQPQLSVSDATVDEAAGTVSVTISLSKASADTVTVKYATEDGSAGAGTDYGAASGTVSFAPGQLTRTIQIPITDNAVVNGARDFTVVLSDSAFAAIIDNTGMLTITDNDVAPAVPIISSVLAEDAAHTGANPVDSSVGETGTLLYTVTLNVSSPSPTEYSLALSGSASGADLGAVSFSDGVDWKNADASTGTVAIAAADDSVIEQAESVVLTVGGVSATGTITDNDSQSVTSVRAEDAAATGANPVDSTVVEGGSLLFTVALNTISPAPTEYAFALGGSATGADLGSIAFSYGVAWKNGDPATGTIVVSANVGSFDVLIATTDDSAIENAESVVLTVGGVSATGTITDNDTAPPVVLPPVVQPPIVQPPIVQPPIVQPPVEPPVTEPPVVQPPVVQPPVVQPPVVQPPVVQPPVVQPPVVQPPVVQPPVVQPPVVQPPVVQPPSIKATLTQASDNGANASDGVTSLVRPEFSIAAGSYLSEGGSVRLVRPDGQVAGSSVITAADAQSGSITVGTAQLDDGVYQFVSEILDSSGKVVASSIVNVTIVTDIDGVAPSVEMAANGGDFNHDGVADWQQHTVAQMPLASLADFLAGKNAAASSFGAILAGDVHAGQPGGGVQLSTGAQLLDLSLSAAPAALPDNLTPASPMFNFSVTSESGAAPLADMDASREGLQTRVVIDLASGGVLSNDFMKWDQQNQRWYSFLDDGRLDTYDNGATLLDTNRDGRTDRIVITLTDGGWGDEDGVANGTIVDPGMLAYSMDPQRAPVYSVLLSTGDRYYSAHAADAARMAAGSGNVFEGVRFDGLDASLGGRHVGAYFQPFTRDWAFAADGESLPYACYGKVVTETGFSLRPLA